MPSSSDRVAPAAAHAFVADLDRPELDEDDRHHLLRVLRLRDGESVTVSDGQGRWRLCSVGGGALTPEGGVETVPVPEVPVTVAFALTKGGKPEWVIQKLTEVGVDVVSPFVAERSVVRWDETKAAQQTERWREVARMAAMQSRRVRLPVIEDTVGFAEIAARPGVALAQPRGSPLSLAAATVMVGPEGGWSAAELALVSSRVDLGDTVLRAETAALAVGIRLCALRAR